MLASRSQGQKYERVAQRWLERRGLETIARNYNCRSGELDLVMQDTGHLVIVEVKYRSAGALVSAVESVTPRKQARIARTALHFLQRHPHLREQPVRFDVVAIAQDPDGPRIDWIRDAFRPAL